MNPRDSASLAFRLAGIYPIVQALLLLGSLLTVLAWDFDSADGPAVNVPMLVLGYLIPVALLVSFGVILISRNRQLADVTILDRDASPSSLQPVQLHAILFSVIGVLLVGLVSTKIPRLFHNFAMLLPEYGSPGWEERRVDFLKDNWEWSAGIGLQLLIGAALLLRGKQLASYFHRSKRVEAVDRLTHRCPHCDHPFAPADYRENAASRRCSKCKNELPGKLFSTDV